MLTSARGPYSSIFSTLGSVLRLSLVPSLRISSCDTWGLQSRWRLDSVLVTSCAYNSTLETEGIWRKAWQLILGYIGLMCSL